MQRLLDGYAAQQALYDRAVAIWRQAEENAASARLWPQDLHAVLMTLTALDAAMAPDKAAWQRSARAPGEELLGLWACIAARIDTLADGVRRCLADVETRQKHLLPALDALVQERRMHQAYIKRL